MGRWALLLAGSTGLIAGSLAAQNCPPPLKKLPAVGLTVAITGCDYLGALAEDSHVRGTSDCAQIQRSVEADTTSRVHALSRMFADSLRPILGHHFGFLSWPESPDTTVWSATVMVGQPHRGTDGTVQIILRSPAGVDTASEALDFESFSAIAGLFREPKTQQALAAVSARWTARVRSLLEDSDGFNRSKLVRSVFRNVPIAALTPAEALPRADGQAIVAPVPVRDTDIRVKPPHRPTFEWQVEKVVRGQPPDEDEGVFLLGECTGRQGYRCKMLRLRYGAASFEGNQVAQFFDATTQLHAPIALHVVDYRPAANVCPLLGVMPQ